jgi:hypothetical protein
MKRVLYKDQEFFYKTHLHPLLQFSDSVLNVYVKTRLPWPFKYKLIGKTRGGHVKVQSDEALESIIESYLNSNVEKPRLIKCSPEIEAIYKDFR